MKSNNSGCLTAFVSSFSRILLLSYWLARPVQMNAAFSTFIIPCLGFVFLPFTTLMYVVLIQGVGSIQGLDWLWLIIAVILDLATLGTAGFANRNRLPGYNSGQTYTAVMDPDQSVPSKPAEPKP